MNPADGMISVEEALERILAKIHRMPREETPLLESLGRVLAEDVVASFDIPPLANSGMDGYALRSEDIQGASPGNPVVLPITGQVAAGQVSQHPLTPGTSIRIMTGAPLPERADTVVPFEDTDELERTAAAPGRRLAAIGIRSALPPGTNVRPAGEDVKAGQLVIERGTLLAPPHLGVLASLGRACAPVVRPPVVAILATGDELREPGESLEPGQVYNANSYTLAALVRASGGVPLVLPIARDTMEDLTGKMASGLDADLFITSAGVSTGEYDLVKQVLTAQGSMDFWRVRMRPGRPLAFGLLRRPDGSAIPHLGLPGNTVATIIAFDQFARPAILKMAGMPAPVRPTVRAIMEGRVANRDHRRCFVRAVVEHREGAYHVRLAGSQGSNILTAMMAANALLVIPEERGEVGPGDHVEAQILEGHEGILFAAPRDGETATSVTVPDSR